MVKLAELTNNGVDTIGKTFILANDLDLKEYCEANLATGGWTPIGNETNNFKGTFNGNGNIISNLIIDRPSQNHQGLFGYSSNGQLYNVGLENIHINTGGYSGPLCGLAKFTKIENCYTKNGKINANMTGVGGLTGYLWLGSISRCYTNINITSSASCVGGILGTTAGGSGGSDLFSSGEITGKSEVGGIVGYHTTSTNLKRCYSTANITGQYRIGGILGNLNVPKGTVNIDSCFSYASVSGNDRVGLFAGSLNLTDNGIDFGVLNISNTFVLDNQTTEVLSLINSDKMPVDFNLSEITNKFLKTSELNISTNLQVGVKSNSNSQIDFNTNFEYNLGKIVRNGIDSDESLELIDNFINTISAKQTELGAVTNRLESALDEIAIQYDNLASSRSTLRDADMAKLSSQYIKMQILQQASATLLATANQSPSIALQLI